MDEKCRAFNELRRKLVEFRQEFESQRAIFLPKEMQLKVHFKGALSEIYYPSDLEEIYGALGYDVEVISSLGKVFRKLNFRCLSDGDTKVITNLLNGLMRVANLIQTLFSDVLNQIKLNMLKSRDINDLKKINLHLVQFIGHIKDLKLKIKAGILSSALKKNAESIVKELKEGILVSHKVMIRNIHDRLFDIVELVELA
ncbi:hypothetical protein [Borrelia miyamotoi]|uniref:Uncharacterized protein n=1 Tax=Borrelia miyamotoi TaxID=47466 RepID=A0AAQ2WXL3_9SPIR|nr:hypothetical protein [Borrelia miyamotoi]AOW96359.1 hypothetical protein AXH25_04295 [Borrelia miyamotoi]QTL84079.1 hypothetical protein bmLB2001_001153 [Borrelia miyamotoi]WAZ85759.1 hypothetical protein O5400_05265 [Borrelia miyamotoi]WAZ91541.1 hypothetical protein O5398_05255 [Borrelia miyamotoi]WAZ92829.1 hypothetical protein O5402_05265 [Borrelia miyamotoi]